jgi:hypothetical protein
MEGLVYIEILAPVVPASPLQPLSEVHHGPAIRLQCHDTSTEHGKPLHSS